MTAEIKRLDLRLTAAQDTILRSAAALQGVSVRDYVLRHALEAAEMDLADRRVFVVDDAAWNELQALVSAKPRLAPRMTKLLSDPSVLDLPDP